MQNAYNSLQILLNTSENVEVPLNENYKPLKAEHMLDSTAVKNNPVVKSFYQEMKKEATHWSYMVPELPRKLYEALDESVAREECQRRKQEKTLQLQTSIRNWLVVLCIFLFLKLFFT